MPSPSPASLAAPPARRPMSADEQRQAHDKAIRNFQVY
jgi:hypothetical protein